SLEKQVEESTPLGADKYKHPVPKKCCYDGARRNDDETCEQRVARITIGPFCIRAFNECCIIAKQYRDADPHKNIQLGRLSEYDIFYQISAQCGELCVILCC
uniref:Anaphylatoxin-like domain-containing protein n=1 Tax=Spermophilus dauricus TaxID=99837 RepID=A0A8C9Q4Z5_SPEDA